MHNDDIRDLEGQIRDKQAELDHYTQVMARDAQTIGRDRWFNRGQHTLHTLRTELAALVQQREAGAAPTDP